MRDFAPIDGVTVIGITGRARSGKDELARAFLRAVPGAERVAFSDAVAAFARATGQMTRRDPRTLQDVGEQLRRFDVDCWCAAMHGWIEDRRPTLAVVTGLRHANEYTLIRAMRGYLIGVVRPDAPPVTDRDPLAPVEQGIAAMLDKADVRFTVPEREHPRARAALFDGYAAEFVCEWLTD